VKDDKISLSIKAVEDREEVVEEIDTAPLEYHSDGEAVTGLGALLQGIQIK
jgi:small subunit ribosomal protein S1